LLGLAGLLGVILYIATDNGTIKITGTDSQMKVLIDGKEVVIENLGKPITFRTGEHQLLVKRDSLEFKTKSFQIRRGAETVLDVTYTEDKWSGAGASNPAESPRPGADLPVAVSPKAESRTETTKPTAALPTPSDPEYLTTRVGQIKLRLIPTGTFQMGSPDGEGDTDEHPQHEVRITRPFYVGVYEVTQAQYQVVTGQNPSSFSSTGGGKGAVAVQSTDQHPVETVSWLDAVKFCNLLSEKDGLKPFYEIEGETVRVPDWSGPGYRLPTEAEWEYACRAGCTAAYSFGGDSDQLDEYAWYDGNSKVNGNGSTHPVGQKRRNAFDLYDMHGNVWEWCWDCYSEGYYKEPTAADPRGPTDASFRVFRGGSWCYSPGYCRSAYRGRDAPEGRFYGVGFRLAPGQSGR